MEYMGFEPTEVQPYYFISYNSEDKQRVIPITTESKTFQSINGCFGDVSKISKEIRRYVISVDPVKDSSTDKYLKLLQKAEQGDATAQDELGNCYYNGERVERDYV